MQIKSFISPLTVLMNIVVQDKNILSSGGWCRVTSSKGRAESDLRPANLVTQNNNKRTNESH